MTVGDAAVGAGPPVPAAVCADALEWARERDYAGWDPYDGLNSPLLDRLRVHWFTRLVGMHGVHKSPVNLRRLLLVPKERNPKGIALFASAYLARYETTGERAHLAEAESLLEWLLEHRSTADGYACWGYNFDWQNATVFYLEAGEPCSVVTVFCAQSFLEHYRLTGDQDSLAVAREAAEFLQDELNIVRAAGHDAYSYTPDGDYVVINANALAMKHLATVGTVLEDDSMLERADELASFVVAAQNEAGAWYYAMPASASHLDHDNFHTGFVLESLHDYLRTRPDAAAPAEAYRRGLAFYRARLFEHDGAPKFEADDRFPRDVHGSAQAIRTLAKDGSARSRRLIERVVGWTIGHLYDEEGYFYRRRGRVLSDTTPYMRWNQAWMCYALATYLAARPGTPAAGAASGAAAASEATTPEAAPTLEEDATSTPTP